MYHIHSQSVHTCCTVHSCYTGTPLRYATMAKLDAYVAPKKPIVTISTYLHRVKKRTRKPLHSRQTYRNTSFSWLHHTKEPTS
jgi:hypothetical protein